MSRRNTVVSPVVIARMANARQVILITSPYFDRAGAPQTQNVRVNERLTVVQNGNRLEYVMTVTEPATLVKPFVWNAFFTWKPDEVVNRYECTLEEWASIKNTLKK